MAQRMNVHVLASRREVRETKASFGTKFCPHCQMPYTANDKENGVKLWHWSCLPTLGLLRYPCPACEEDYSPEALKILKTKPGTRISCQGCESCGRWDPRAWKQEASYENSVWFDWDKRVFECVWCFLEKQIVLRLRDDDGEWVTAGDVVHFSYGIPPVGVGAKIIERDGKLIGLCPGHNPSEFNLRSLRRCVGNWYKQNK